jgi:hypothetical protein
MSCVPAYTDRAIGGMSTRYARWPGGVLRQGGTEAGLAAAVEGECRGRRLPMGRHEHGRE